MGLLCLFLGHTPDWYSLKESWSYTPELHQTEGYQYSIVPCKRCAAMFKTEAPAPEGRPASIAFKVDKGGVT
jgi:hypothetical protein